MKYRILGNNIQIPVIGLGTWGMGGFLEKDLSQDEKVIQAIRNALSLGYTHIDSAELYAAGHTEELIGKAIRTVDRSKLIITDKVYNTNLQYNDVIASCKKSLERLQTSYIDIYLIHAPNPNIPIEETMLAMDYLVEQNFVKFIGVSNFSVKEMIEAQKYSKNKIIVNQIPYNLSTRNKDYKNLCALMESEIIPFCQKNSITVMAYRPLERGLLLKPHPVLDKLSNKYNKTKAQIAINWLISKPGVITITKAINIKHLKENLGAVGWNLRNEDIIELDDAEFEKPMLS
jgi:diketogulonate reductase-like aldo/keto reductase